MIFPDPGDYLKQRAGFPHYCPAVFHNNLLKGGSTLMAPDCVPASRMSGPALHRPHDIHYN